MITVGIDVGNKTTKAIVLKDGKVAGKSLALTGFDQNAAAEQSFTKALSATGVSRSAVAKIVSTGAGRLSFNWADEQTTEVGADAKGVFAKYPNVRIIIDIGAEVARAIKLDDRGYIADFAINEKCAAGAGSFIESMSRILETTIENMGPLSLKSNKTIPMNAQCVVFAESEVVSLIHQNTSPEDIAKAVHDAIAARIISMVRRVGMVQDVALIGGVAFNVGFQHCLKDGLETNLVLPEDPEYYGALGAALKAAGV